MQGKQKKGAERISKDCVNLIDKAFIPAEAKDRFCTATLGTCRKESTSIQQTSTNDLPRSFVSGISESAQSGPKIVVFRAVPIGKWMIGIS